MKKILVTGGTVFVSRFVAEYYVKKNCEVYVLNRNTKPQSQGVKLIESDRADLGDVLKSHHFNAVIDVTSYNENDVNLLLDGLGSFDDYIFISSSAVYPEYVPQPFLENSTLGENKYWGKYGTNKIEAEMVLSKRVPNAYILRPPYLYGQMNNIYREAFVFDCAMQDRKFHLPQNGDMKLQFLHVEDLCKFIDTILETKPKQRVFNVGNQNAITVKEWVEACYAVVGKRPEFVNVFADVPQRSYFPFYDYEYYLDVSAQHSLIPAEKNLHDGLTEAFEWYKSNQDKVNKKPLIEFIENNMAYKGVK